MPAPRGHDSRLRRLTVRCSGSIDLRPPQPFRVLVLRPEERVRPRERISRWLRDDSGRELAHSPGVGNDGSLRTPPESLIRRSPSKLGFRPPTMLLKKKDLSRVHWSIGHASARPTWATFSLP